METSHLEPPKAASAETAREAGALEHRLVLALSLVLVVAMYLIGGWLEPDDRGFGTHEKLGMPPCMMMRAGVPCPGCGVTTSVTLATNGRVWDSIRNQPFGFAFFLAVQAFLVWTVVTHFRGRNTYDELRRIRLGRWVLWPLGFIVVSWIYKIVQVASA